MEMSRIILRKNEERRIKSGHQWIFSNEIEKVEDKPGNGAIVKVYDYKNNFLLSGFYNFNSLIAVRTLTASDNFDLKELFDRRLDAAFKLRNKVYPGRNSYRAVFSESDFLPGLIIDKYNDTFVLQIYSAGMENNIALINEILSEKYNAKNIFTKNEEYFRRLEGLPEADTVYKGEMSEEIISDGFVKYRVNFGTGHKTGFYFDQCDNRAFIQRFSKSKSVLDCFCNSGGFGLNAAYGGAESVVFVDSSAVEIKAAEENFILNSFGCETEFKDADVFDYLEKCVSEGKKFDIVNVDPPAFAKNKKSLQAAIKGYEKLNRLALEVLKEGGLLFSSSCSYHLKRDEFISVLKNAGAKSGKELQLIHFNNASMDHPSLPAMEETVYLKFAVCRVL